MVFSSISFLYYFLPLSLVSYWLVGKKVKNVCLLIFSLLFYSFGEPKYIVIMLLSIGIDYSHGLLIEKYRGGIRAKLALFSSLFLNIGMLAVFKYSVNLVDHLPIGISFFTFQTMSYSIDVYQNKIKANRNLIEFATYVSMFPQLVAGPIVRYRDVVAQMKERRLSSKEYEQGAIRFVEGLTKKVILANSLGELHKILLQAPEQSFLNVWASGSVFLLQLYYDFSGYSDMAIGLGSFFGFRFPENFLHPLSAKSITSFWQKWHISLGSWFRDYLYIPLGGNRGGRVKQLRNIMLVWTLTGVWHGAGWNFLLWGFYFGLLLAIEKFILGKYIERLPKFLQHSYTLCLSVIGFILFQEENVKVAVKKIGRMLGLDSVSFLDEYTLYYMKNYLFYLIIALLFASPLHKKFFARRNTAVNTLLYSALFILSTAYLVDSSYNPFLYFRF